MTGDDGRRGATPEETGQEPPPDRAAPRHGSEEPAGRVPDPEPEEAPELLGEHSDYPIAWGDEEG